MIQMVVVGASAGGIDALKVLFSGLPAPFPVPVVVVLHVHPDTRSIVGMFQENSKHKIIEAVDGDRPVAGTIYLAPSDYHLYIELDGSFSLCAHDRIHHVRPAVDPLFASAAQYAGSHVVGVILTGAHIDGANGLLAIQERGGIAVVQDPASAEVNSMPAEALHLTKTSHLYSLGMIPQALTQLVRGF